MVGWVCSLSWSWAPVLILATFVVTAMGHFMTKAVVEAAWTTARRNLRLLTP
jgi:hypothetical protein